MRALNKGWIGIILVILFGASLFFFRGSARYSNLFNSDNFVANVSGTQISTSQFLRALELNIGQFAQMIGQDLSGDQIRAFQIHQLVLQNLVNNAIFENEFDNINYIIDDTVIAKKTKERFPNLYNNNQINDDSLNNFLKQQRLKIEDVVNIINYETRGEVFDNLFFDENYPLEFSKKISLYNEQIRSVDLLKVSYENINLSNFDKQSIDKNDNELINFFEEKKLNYMSNEKRDISFIEIYKDSYRNNFVPNNDEILDYYNTNKEIFTIPEKRSFKQFNFKSKIEADDFRLKINSLNVDDIISYATENNVTFNNFKDVDKNQVLEELSNVIFSLKENEISNVVTTTLANHIIILEGINNERKPSLNEVSEQIKNTLTIVQLDNFFNDLKLKISQQILDGYSLNELAEENQLSLKNLKNVSQESNENNEFENAIVKSAFTQNKDFISDILDFNDNKSFIINVDEIYPSKVEKIDTVLDIVIDDFIKFKKLNFASETFNNFKNSNNLEGIKNIFKSNIDAVKIKLNSEDLPKSLTKKIFDSKLNELTFSSDDKNIYFASVNKIEIPDKIQNSQDINLISELKNAFGNEIIKTKKISVNDELINGLLSQYK